MMGHLRRLPAAVVLAGLLLACASWTMAQAEQPWKIGMAPKDGNPALLRPGESPAGMAEAARYQLQELLAEIIAGEPDSLPPGFPFAVRDVGDLRNAELGFSFRVFTVDVPGLLAENESALEDLVIPTETWRITVLVDGRPAGLLTMESREAGWEIVSMGGAVLAKEIQELTERFARLPGCEFRFVRVFQATADFLEVRQTGTVLGFAPFQSARISMKLDSDANGPGALLDGLEVTSGLKDMVRASIREGK